MNINRLNLKVLDIIIGKFSASSFSQSLRLSKDTIKVVLPESNEPNACSDVKSAQVSFSYTVPDTLCRRVNGMLQPILSTAAALAVLDEVSTYSFILKDRTCRGGVSVHLTTEMLSPCVAGESVVIHTRLRKLGKTLGFCDFEMVSADKSKSGQVIARGQHIKHLPLGGAWDAIASPTLLPLVLRLHDLLFDGNNNAPTTPWARWFTRWAFGGVNSSDLKQVSGEGGVFKAVALQPVGRGAKGSVVNRFESTPAMNNVLGKLHGGAVAVALETAALTSYRIFHDEQQTHADLGARQTLSHPDDVFLSSMSVRYLDALKVRCYWLMINHYLRRSDPLALCMYM